MSMNLQVFPVLWLSVSFDERNVYSTYRRETRDIDGTTLSRRLGPHPDERRDPQAEFDAGGQYVEQHHWGKVKCRVKQLPSVDP